MVRVTAFHSFIALIGTVIVLRLSYYYLSQSYNHDVGPTYESVLSTFAHLHIRHDALRRTLLDTMMSPDLTAQRRPCTPQATDNNNNNNNKIHNDDNNNDNTVCLLWDQQAHLQLSVYNDHGAECYDMKWQSLKGKHKLQDCFSMREENWYGGSETPTHHWPINPTFMRIQPYITNDVGMLSEPGHGSIQERYWLTSSGVAVTVNEHVPLEVGMEPNKYLCLRSRNKPPSPFPNTNGALPRLEYTVCAKSNILDVHKYMSKRLWNKPEGIPHEKILRNPMWSTWAKFKRNITQKGVISFADEIRKNGFTASHIEIDDGYATKYGDHEFSPKKFPDAKSMVTQLHEMGFTVSLWITPFVNNDSQAFQEGVKNGYFVRAEHLDGPAMVKWWRGWAGLLDITNDAAVEWYYKRLQTFRDIGIDAFKFDAGEAGFLPINGQTKQLLINPNMYSALYVKNAYKFTNNAIEIRTGYRTQHLPLIVRMMDKDSNWVYHRGFKSIIPTALQFSLLGYNFILPDMIGGNGYPDRIHYGLPNKFLYIRWIQLSIFFPSMQFSFTPWQYDEETMAISLKMMKFRTDFIFPRILKLAHQCVDTGEPIIRPMWWIAPTDPLTLDQDSQFLLGDELIVAPIVEEGAVSRDIYLPIGRWRDVLHQTDVTGPQQLRNYAVALDEVAVFERLS